VTFWAAYLAGAMNGAALALAAATVAIRLTRAR
jgi:hypothetical protein